MNARIKSFLIIIWGLTKIAILIAIGLAILIGIICLIVGWRSIYSYATILQYAAILTFFLGGSGFLGEFRRPIITHRPGDLVSQYKQRLNIFDSNIYQLVVGTIVTLLLYLASKWLYSQ